MPSYPQNRLQLGGVLPHHLGQGPLAGPIIRVPAVVGFDVVVALAEAGGFVFRDTAAKRNLRQLGVAIFECNRPGWSSTVLAGDGRAEGYSLPNLRWIG